MGKMGGKWGKCPPGQNIERGGDKGDTPPYIRGCPCPHSPFYDVADFSHFFGLKKGKGGKKGERTFVPLFEQPMGNGGERAE